MEADALSVICRMTAAVADAGMAEVFAHSNRVLDGYEVGARVVAG